MKTKLGKLAIVTEASTGIGYELAKCCARDGFDLHSKGLTFTMGQTNVSQISEAAFETD